MKVKQAFRCDRCKELFEPYADDEINYIIAGRLHLNTGVVANRISFDLCKSCANKLNDWLYEFDPASMIKEIVNEKEDQNGISL